VKKISALLVLIAAVAALSAQGVAEDELRSVRDKTIEFINYEGPHTRIDTLEEIQGLGADIGRAAAGGAMRAGSEARYAVIRVRDPSAPGLDADIILLGPDAQVDHIRNLRHILGAYLESAYGYSQKDAYLLATFLTVYNAVYRGNLEYFGKAYKSAVSTYLTKENAGLAIRYDEWPGKSRIVLPISSKAGAAAKIDTTPITEKPVVESLKKESGTAAIPERQDMVDLKEREVAGQKAEIEAKKADVAKEEQAVTEEKARTEAARQELEAAKTEAAQSGAGEKGPEQQAALTQREAEVQAQEAAVAEKEKTVAAAKEDVAKQETAVAAKETEIAQDRKVVAEDQKAEIAKEVAAKTEGGPKGSVLLDLVDPSQPYARLALVDIAGGKYIKVGDMNTLRVDSFLDAGGAYVAVAGKTGGSGAVRLVILDLATLSAKVTGNTDVHPETGVWKDSAGIYAVAKDGGKWVLGLFDPATLELKAKSEAEVSPFTFFKVVPEGIVVAGSRGGLILLKKDDLKTVKEISR
jgi:hypothetical protein